MHFDQWWNSQAADSFRAKHDDMYGDAVQPVWDAAVAAERERCLSILRSVDNHSNPMTANDCADLIASGAQP